MKTAIIVLLFAGLVLSAGPACAQQTPQQGDSGTLTAQVDTVTLAQDVGEYSSISVVDAYGEEVIFDVMAATPIYGHMNEPIGLDSISQGDTVEIEYSNLSGGLGVAKSIKLTEQQPN